MRKTEAREVKMMHLFKVTLCDDCGREDAQVTQPTLGRGGDAAGYTVNRLTEMATCDHLGDVPEGWSRFFAPRTNTKDFCPDCTTYRLRGIYPRDTK